MTPDGTTGRTIDARIEHALVRLAEGPDDALLLDTVKEMVVAGLPGLGVRLLRAETGLLEREPDLQEVTEKLAALPSGEVPRSIRQARFDANLAALRRDQPDLDVDPDDLETVAGDVHVYRSAAGNRCALRETPGGRPQFLLPFTEARGHAEAIAPPGIAAGDAFVHLGVPSEAVWRRTADLRLPIGYVPPLDVVELDRAALLVWLSMLDLTEDVGDERVHVFGGPAAVETYQRFLLAHPWRRPATMRVQNERVGARLPEFDAVFHEPISRRSHERRGAALRRQAELYDGRDWARRFAKSADGGPPLRVLGLTSRFSTVVQYAMRDLAGAFRRRGCDFDILIEPSPSCGGISPSLAVAERAYDMVIAIDFLRFQIADVHPGIPFVGWIQDHMPALWTEAAGRSVGPRDLVIGGDPVDLHTRFGYPLDRCLTTSNLTDAFVYAADPVPDETLAPYRCDLCYVGHGSQTPAALAAEIAAAHPGPAARVIPHLLRIVESRRDGPPVIGLFDRLELILEAEQAAGGAPLAPSVRRSVLVPAVDRIHDRILRHETLQWAAGWADDRGATFKLFGRGWSSHPTLARFACGEIANGFFLRCLHQAAAMTLQATGYRALHQRLLDAVASGGFVLSRHNPADFMGETLRAIGAIIERDGISSMEMLLAQRRRNEAMDHALDRLRRQGGASHGPVDDPERRRQARLLRDVYALDDAAMTDAALFETLRLRSGRPRRGAGDLPGFGALTFGDRAELEALLDRYRADGEARRAAVGPMREAVVRLDTFDRLADRIMAHFRTILTGATAERSRVVAV